MKCERARDLLSDYLEGDLDYALEAVLRGHIGQCSSCEREVKLLKQTWERFDSLPEVEPPRNFRHDTVMRVARIQHERSIVARQEAWGNVCQSFFQRFVPTRTIAIAGAVIALALVMMRVPESAYNYAKSALGPGIDIHQASESNGDRSDIWTSPLCQLESERKQEWRSRVLGRNTLWVSIDPKNNGEGRKLYRVTLSINEDAFMANQTSSRVWSQVQLLPPNQFGQEAIQSAGSVWEGSILSNSPIMVPVIVDKSQSQAGSVNLLVSWKFRGRYFSQIVIIPSKGSSSKDNLDFGVGHKDDNSDGNSIFSALQAIAQEYGVPVVCDAQLNAKSSVMQFGDGTMEDALNAVLKPAGLDWLPVDNAIHVDKKYPKKDAA